MNVELFMQYVSYVLVAIGALSFLVSVIVQAIKEMPWFKNVQTNVVVLTASLILCPMTMVVTCQYFQVKLVWYYIFAAFIAAFIVYLVATGGWERVAEMWDRTKFRKE